MSALPSVLMVDDEEDFREVVMDHLSMNRFEVHEAENGAAMRKIIGGEPIGAALLDQRLPGEADGVPFGAGRLNLNSRTLLGADGEYVALTAMEFDLLKAFADQPSPSCSSLTDSSRQSQAEALHEVRGPVRGVEINMHGVLTEAGGAVDGVAVGPGMLAQPGLHRVGPCAEAMRWHQHPDPHRKARFDQMQA